MLGWVNAGGISMIVLCYGVMEGCTTIGNRTSTSGGATDDDGRGRMEDSMTVGGMYVTTDGDEA